MHRVILVFILLLSLDLVSCKPEESRPKLMVGIVIDQMRQEYLYRFSNHYGEGGFKRLMNGGFMYKNAHYNYPLTKTGPGHATIYTGTTPNVHGIIGNDWYDKRSRKMINCVEDNDVSTVGSETVKIGQRSPKNLLSTTITDEMRLFFQGKTKIVSISAKDRGAIIPGGHQPNGAYWYDPSTGMFVTSTFYQNELPKWVVDFNNKKLPQEYMDKTWDTFFPIEQYVESEADNRPFEKPFISDIPPIFPYDFKEISKSRNAVGMLTNTPFSNTILTELAIDAIENEELGLDGITDFLAISFSSTDYIGHDFGPYSKEIQDTYVRMDRELDRLFNELDKKVGKGNWSMFLTADHAIAAIPGGLKEKKMPGGNFPNGKIIPIIKSQIDQKFETEGLVEKVYQGQVYFNREVLIEKNLDLVEVKKYTIELIQNLEGIAGAYDVGAIHANQTRVSDDPSIGLGLNLLRSGDVVFILAPGWLEGNLNGGTDHSSPYSYDTNVPIIFYGKGIQNGTSVQYKTITSIAPTVSMLLNITLPSACTGRPLDEALEKQ